MSLPDIIIDKVAIWDTYKTDYTTFNICGHDIYVYDDELAKVIKQLSDRYREKCTYVPQRNYLPTTTIY